VRIGNLWLSDLVDAISQTFTELGRGSVDPLQPTDRLREV
jgi:hypothetical protein